MGMSDYFGTVFETRADHKLDKTPIPETPSEASPTLSAYTPSDEDDSFDVDASGELPESVVGDKVKGLSGGLVSESSGTAAGAGASDVDSIPGFVDPFPDFQWMTTEEPHRSRRVAILKAHPEVRKLMGPTPLTFPLVLFVNLLQISLAYHFRSTHPLSLSFLLTAYIIGATANQNTFLAIHEITHNLAFRSIRANKALAVFANLVIGVPYAMAFKGYHIEHHKFLGEDGIDTDIPSRLEAIVLNNVAGKTFFATFQILFYALRPGFIRSQTPTMWHAYNVIAILSFDFLIVKFCGWYSMFYLLISSFLAGSLHPCAAHFIAEHYLMNDEIPEKGSMQALGQETTSYYGWLNILCYNVGYHNEHHDFPSVPWTRLPALRRIASEFYEPLPAHKSWPYVTWKFITDPNVGMWSRAKRQGRGEKLSETVWMGDHVKVVVDAPSDEDEIEMGYASERDEGCKASRTRAKCD